MTNAIAQTEKIYELGDFLSSDERLSAKTIPREQSEREEDTKAAARNSIRVWKLGLCEVGFGEYSFFV
jgi:hypothetical protein